LEKIPGQLEASFLIFLTLGSIKQSNNIVNLIGCPTPGLYSDQVGSAPPKKEIKKDHQSSKGMKLAGARSAMGLTASPKLSVGC